MKKTVKFLLALAVVTLLFTSFAAANGAKDIDKSVVGIWYENPDRDGNIETLTCKKDGTFSAEITTQDGKLLEIDSGTWSIEDGFFVIRIKMAGGYDNGGVLEPLGVDFAQYYRYSVTATTLHTERVKRVIDGNVETFDSTLADNYIRK